MPPATGNSASDTSAATAKGSASGKPLYMQFPVASTWEFTLKNKETVQGKVYCTDPVANIVALQSVQAPETVWMLSVPTIQSSKQLQEAPKDAMTNLIASNGASITSSDGGSPNTNTNGSNGNGNGGSATNGNAGASGFNMAHSKKALEEREKRAIRLAQDSFRHINSMASPKGQAVFDRLLKACNDVVWKGESIIVLNQIKVDAPYGKDNCKLLKAGTGASSLDRIQKIVASAPP